MNLTEEEKKSLIEAMQHNDITVGAPPQKEAMETMSPEENVIYQRAKDKIEECMIRNLADAGFGRSLHNYSPDYPPKLLIESLSHSLSTEVVKALHDESSVCELLDQYVEIYGDLLEPYVDQYCKESGKCVEDIDFEALCHVSAKLLNILPGELTSILLQGYQLPEILAISADTAAFEDFANSCNPDAINHYHAWTHDKTKVGAMLSLDDEMLMSDGRSISGGIENEVLSKLQVESFYHELNDTDVKICEMAAEKYTQSEIAKEIGLKSHSAVSKRLRHIRAKLDAFNGKIDDVDDLDI